MRIREAAALNNPKVRAPSEPPFHTGDHRVHLAEAQCILTYRSILLDFVIESVSFLRDYTVLVTSRGELTFLASDIHVLEYLPYSQLINTTYALFNL